MNLFVMTRSLFFASIYTSRLAVVTAQKGKNIAVEKMS
jgi:hypothetical protein